MQASSTAKMGLVAQQTRLDTIANNLANANTSGFRARQVQFRDMLYNKMTRPVGSQEGNLQKGTGVLVASTDLNMSQGIPEMTGISLDFMIDGDGMFAVRDSQGRTLYTRNGSFAISLEGEERYLVTAAGYHVLDENGERIELPEGIVNADISVDLDGTLNVKGEEAGFAKLGLYWFPNPSGLDSEGNTCFAQSASSGEATEAPAGTKILQGYLEGANIDVGMEMVNMIKTQRAFSLASRAITTADEMDALANNMRA